MHVNAKRPTHPHEAGKDWLVQLSKAALVDLVLDAMEIVLDESDPDSGLVEQMREWAIPRLRIRDDKIPNLPGGSR